MKGCESRTYEMFLENNIVGGISLLNFKSYITTVIKTMWCFQRDVYIDQWNKIEQTEIDPHEQDQLIFDKDVKPI